MTVKELKEILENFSDETEVLVYSRVQDPENPNYVGSLDEIKSWAENGSSIQLEIETSHVPPFQFKSL